MALQAQLAGSTIGDYLDKATKTANEAAAAKMQLFQAGVDALAKYKDAATARANDQFLKIIAAKGVSPTQFAADPNGAAVMRQLYRGIPGLNVDKMISGLAGSSMSTEEAMAAAQSGAIQGQFNQAAPAPDNSYRPTTPGVVPVSSPAPAQPAAPAVSTAPAAPNKAAADPYATLLVRDTTSARDTSLVKGVQGKPFIVIDPRTGKEWNRFDTEDQARDALKYALTNNIFKQSDVETLAQAQAVQANSKAAALLRSQNYYKKLIYEDKLDSKAAAAKSGFDPSTPQATLEAAAKTVASFSAQSTAPAAAATVAPSGDPTLDGFRKFVLANNPNANAATVGSTDLPTLQSQYKNGWAAFSKTIPVPAAAPAAAPVPATPSTPAAPAVQPVSGDYRPIDTAASARQKVQDTAVIRQAASTITMNKDNTAGWNQSYLNNLQNIANNLQTGLNQSPDPETGKQLQYVDYMKKLAAERPQLAEQKLKSDLQATEVATREAWARGDLYEAQAGNLPMQLALETSKAKIAQMEANSKQFAQLMAPVHAQEVAIDSAMKEIATKNAGDPVAMVNQTKKWLDAFNASPEGKNYAATMAQATKLTGMPFAEKQVTEDIAKNFLFIHWKEQGTPYTTIAPVYGGNAAGGPAQPMGVAPGSKASDLASKYAVKAQ
jgi:hypothetical protein